MRAIATIAMLIATPATAADQFDLECNGTIQEEINGPVKPHKFGFRINLVTRTWCWDHCERTFPIQEVMPERIVLRDERKNSAREELLAIVEIDRRTGKFSGQWIEIRPFPLYRKTLGDCVVKPFSGFPQTKF